MTDKISKELARLSNKERGLTRIILLQLKQNDTNGLQVSKLKGHQDIVRVRKGRLRIIYRQLGNVIKILAIERHLRKNL